VGLFGSIAEMSKRSSAPKRDRPAEDLAKVDGIVLLENDHKALRALFDAFKVAKDKARNDDEKKTLVEQMAVLLKAHTQMEEIVFYPAAREVVPELDATVLESYEEHHVVDLLCEELFSMSPTDENFVAKTSVLMDCVTRHMDDEEQDWFPKVRAALTAEKLQDIGDQMARIVAEQDEP
jgi:hemerythrin-like domain-containing protein